MIHFEKEDLQHLQSLCAFELSEEEKTHFLTNLQKIIEYVHQLSELETEQVKPCHFVSKELQKNVYRKDEVTHSLSREAFLENAPEQIGGMIKVPPVMK